MLEKDKFVLLENIDNLDKRRVNSLNECFFHVKTNFTKIFSYLLPGATAYLSLIN